MDTGQWLSCFDSCQLTVLWMSNVKDVDLSRHAWDTPPFLLIVSPTPPVQSVDAYVRSVNHVTTKRKEVDHNLWVWGSVPRALRARRSPAIISRITISGSRKSYCSTLGTVLRQKAELWRPSLKIIKSDSGKTQDHYVWDTHKSSLTVRQNRRSIGDW